MDNINCLSNGLYSLYDSIYEIIDEYSFLNYDMELNLNTVDEITTYVDEYIRGKLGEFEGSIKYKKLEDRLYAAVAEEFNVPFELFERDEASLYSAKERLAISVVNYIRNKYMGESTCCSEHEELESMIEKDEELFRHISKIKEAVGIV